ncbi:MAG: glycosyltransferase family 4 protein [Methyloversatilis sp.]|nr:glycosyltransferase family 4 protein [Methyloversatilis sp.]
MTARRVVLFVTHDPFWRLGGGERTRNLALAWMLGQLFDLHLFCLAPVGDADRKRLAALRVSAKLHPCADAEPAAAFSRLAEIVSEIGAHACILAKLRLDFLADALSPGVLRILDTHDLVSDNVASRARAGLEPWGGIDLSFDEEMQRLARYDHVLLIQQDDARRVAAAIGSRALCVPHPVSFARQPVRAEGRVLGFVASGWQGNVDALDWFAHEVWPALDGVPTELHVWGSVCQVWAPPAGVTAIAHGFVADYAAIWGRIDVAINPVRWGSGLKIKNVEALGHGVPLVTTTEGARGLDHDAGRCFRVADDPDRFARHCRELLADAALREQTGARGHDYAALHFSPQTCFAPLIRALSV